MEFTRSAGILLHPTSLPGKYGIGDLGNEAFKFIDFLKDAGQKLWQVFPLGPTGYGDSPYQCFSAFAGNPLLISPDKLKEEGFLSKKDLAKLRNKPKRKPREEDAAPARSKRKGTCMRPPATTALANGFSQPRMTRSSRWLLPISTMWSPTFPTRTSGSSWPRPAWAC